tara:strand:- start:991 stop:1383 length:393 start_codon:yes stop_codon:yes gene_type:complete
MDFPALEPTARTFDPGSYPVKTFKAQNGSETRILYGSSRTDMKLSLTFANIPDAYAELFVNHYDDRQGSFKTFSASKLGKSVLDGWEGTEDSTIKKNPDNTAKYRYESAPVITQVAAGVSTVTVALIGVV